MAPGAAGPAVAVAQTYRAALDFPPLRFPRGLSSWPSFHPWGNPVSHAHEQRAAAQRARDKQRLADYAMSLRRRAHQQAYAGFDGDYVANAEAAGLEMIVLHWDATPEPVRRAFLKAASYHFDGPSGQHDPRGNLPALADGPGY